MIYTVNLKLPDNEIEVDEVNGVHKMRIKSIVLTNCSKAVQNIL